MKTLWRHIAFWGMAVGLAVFLQGRPGIAATGGVVELKLDQVPISELARLVGEKTGRRFVFGEQITGKVTAIASVSSDQLYPFFVSILESAGYTVIEREDVCEIVRLPAAGAPLGKTVGPGEETPDQGLVTKVIQLENISVADVKRTLQAMVRGGREGALEAFEPTNHLIITDTAENVRRIERILKELDKPGAAKTVEFVRLKHASAEQVAAYLMAGFRAGDSATPGVRIAERLGATRALQGGVGVFPATHANGLVLMGTPVQLSELRQLVEAMDAPPESEMSRLNAIFLKYLSAEEAAKSLNALLAKTADKDQRARIAIEPNVPNNALIVDAAPQDFEFVRKLVEQLDQVPQQVMLEILIAEVAFDKSLDLGVEWSTIELPKEGESIVVGRSRPGEQDAIMDYVTKGIFPQGLSLGVVRGTYQDAQGNVVPRIPVLLRALAANRDVNILSSVPLRAQNNTEASVSVVENIPVLRSTIEGGSGTARDVIQNIDRIDVGIKLKFTPHVNPNGDITLQLNPSIEAVIEESTSEMKYTPRIAKREVSTTVTVPDRSTIVISGLIREDRNKMVSKVPLLGDIPWVGALFRYTRDVKRKTNLLVFVTPHIVTSPEVAADMDRQIMERGGFSFSRTNQLGHAASRER